MSGLDELRVLLALSSTLPWDRDALYSGIRHLDRNCEWYGDHWDEDRNVDIRVNVPFRDDADLIVAAVNALPALLAVVDAAEKLIAGVIGDEDTWLNEWCAMFDAIGAFKKGNK